MPMTVVVTRNAPGRISGFLASCMCEIGPGVYTAPRMNKAVRSRIWQVLEQWFCQLGQGDLAIVMTWRTLGLPGGQDVLTLGVPRRRLVEHDGVFLAARPLLPKEAAELHAVEKTSGTAGTREGLENDDTAEDDAPWE